MTRNKLYLMLAATVAATGLAGSASASLVGPPQPNAADFKLTETPTGFGGVYSVTNNSDDWYITSFAVTNPTAQSFFAFAETQQDNWEAGKFCNDNNEGSSCGHGGIGVAEESQFAGNPALANELGVGYGFYYYNTALEGNGDLLSTSIGPHTVNDSNFEFINAVPRSTVQFNLVDANGDVGTLVFPAGGVPEPASWALMIGGFGLAGAALRRRRLVSA